MACDEESSSRSNFHNEKMVYLFESIYGSEGTNYFKIKIVLFFIVLNLFFVKDGFSGFSGIMEYDYNVNHIVSEDRYSRISTFRENYNLNYDNYIISPSLFKFTSGIGYSFSKYRPTSTPDSKATNIGLNFVGNIFSRKAFPLIVLFNQSETTLDIESLPIASQPRVGIFKSRSTNYGFIWRFISKRRLPTLTTNFNRLENKNFYSNSRREARNTAGINLIKGGQRLRYNLAYSFEGFDDKEFGNETESHVLNGNIERQMTLRSIVRGFSSWSKTNTGHNENIGANLYLRHANKADSNYEYTFSRSVTRPSSKEFYSNSARYSFRYNPSLFLSSNFNLAGSVIKTDNLSHNINTSSGVTYRFSDNLNGDLSGSVSEQQSTGVTTIAQNYQTGINYSKNFNPVQLASLVNTNYNHTSSNPGKVSQTNTNTFSINLTSRTFKYAQLFARLRLARVIARSLNASYDSEEQGYSTGFNSRFRLATLRASLSYTNVSISGDVNSGRNKTYTLNSGIDYSLWKGITIQGGYDHSIFDVGDSTSTTQQIFIQGSFARRITRSLNLNTFLKHQILILSRAVNRYSRDIEFKSHLDYTIGKLFFSAEYGYRVSRTETSISQHLIMLRAARRF